ncbi:MAG TPA: arginine--tRNA ligase, partial [Dehalococcoidia bacterium]|nr:arginine--tRNA ligase [Dehalococcoidia bacterium]
MLKHKIAQLLEQAALEAQQRGLLPQVALPEIAVEHPAITVYGDYACNFPLKLARIAGTNPLDIAERMTKLIPSIPEVEKIEVASPGFINFTLRRDWLTQQVEVILQAGEAYGDLDVGRGSRAQLEFVSVNPTGPLHVGHGRGAVLGSTLANVLTTAGYSVEREYYVNDAGAQMDAFYRSLYARYRQALNL